MKKEKSIGVTGTISDAAVKKRSIFLTPGSVLKILKYPPWLKSAF